MFFREHEVKLSVFFTLSLNICLQNLVTHCDQVENTAKPKVTIEDVFSDSKVVDNLLLVA